MPAVAGRSTESRTVTVTTTASSTALTAPAGTFDEEDAGATIVGTGIPAGDTLASVTSDTAATLAVAATAGGTPVVTIGGDHDGLRSGFWGWCPESDAESETYSITGGASADAPGNIKVPNVAVERRSRSVS